jgi:hypothetical protein
MADPEVIDLPIEVRVRFAHAALQHLADGASVDLLHVKGPAVDPSVVPHRPAGTDADVLVRPSHLPCLLDALGAHGWVVHTSADAGSPFGHAVTLHHPTWGHADLHRLFPGTTVDPEVAFQRLWRTRGSMAIAAIDCTVPSRLDQAMILALNAARGGPHAAPDLAAVWGSADDAQRDAIRAAAAAIGAEVALAAAIGELDRHTAAREHDLWLVTSTGGSRTEEWRARIKAAPTITGRLRLIARAPRVNAEHLAVRLGRPPTRVEVVGEFFSRLRRAGSEAVHPRAGRGSTP